MSTVNVDKHDLSILLVCAARYSITGGIVAPTLVAGIVRRAMDTMDDDTLQSLIFDVEHSLHHADAKDEMRCRAGEHRPLWVDLLKTLVAEKDRRLQANKWAWPAATPTPIAFDGGHL
jgi:hypothetical protein